VTMYTINPTPNSTVTLAVETPDDLNMAEAQTGADPFGATIDFTTLGPATGGRAFLSRNDINNEIAEGIDQGNNYYTLSYAPTNRSDDAAKFRNIVIVMKDKNLHPEHRGDRGSEAGRKPAQAGDLERRQLRHLLQRAGGEGDESRRPVRAEG
jgi:hypothetical protein